MTAPTAIATADPSADSYDECMVREISPQELQDEDGEIMQAVKNGESFVVTCDGEPVARLEPLLDRYLVPTEVVLEAFKDAPHVDYEKFRADLDAVIDQDPWPRV